MSTKVLLVKAMIFPIVMYECESWIIKKAEHTRIDAFELQCWRRLLKVSWIARRSNQSILKEISPGCSLEGLMLKLKLQYFGHLMQRADSFEKTLMLGEIESRRRRRRQRMRLPEQLERQPEFHSSDKTKHDSPAPTLQGPCSRSQNRRGSLRCWWTSRLLPCPGYYKQCCDEHWGTRVSFNSGFLGVYAQQWDCWIIRQFHFQFFKESPHCSP